MHAAGYRKAASRRRAGRTLSLYAESSSVLAWLLGDEQAHLVREQLSVARFVFASELTLVECDRVLHRAVALGELSEAVAAERRALVDTAAEHWSVFAIDADIVARSRRAFPFEPLRTLDALHLSTALLARNVAADVQLLSLDTRLRRNAAALGLEVLPRA